MSAQRAGSQETADKERGVLARAYLVRWWATSSNVVSPKIAFVIALLPLGAMSVARQSLPTDNHAACGKQPCLIVRVDAVSADAPTYGAANTLRCSPETCEVTNVTVSDGKNTYQLTCNRENKNCVAPAVGADYQFVAIPSDKPADLNDAEGEYPHRGKVVTLRKANATAGTFWLAAQMPRMQNGEMARLLAACKSSDDTLADNDCAKWLARRAQIARSPCLEADDSAACNSFRGLVLAGDPDVMDVLARMEHVYVCFHPREDSFFDLWFSEPNERSWSKADADDRKVWGLATGALMQFTFPGVNHYENGVKDKSAGIDGTGSVWSYSPTTKDISPSILARLATSSDAELNGTHFHIDTSRIEASESYRNRSRENIRHVLVLQRSTGRFTESYEKELSGQAFLSYSGRCLVIRDATDGNLSPQ